MMRPENQRKLLLLLFITATVVLLPIFFFSWKGGSLGQPSPNRLIPLGPRTPGEAERIALTRLAREVDAFPDVRNFQVCWTRSWFTGFLEENQWTITYDRKEEELAEYHLLSGPLEEWTHVSPSLLRTLAPTGFDAETLTTNGARSRLP